jgi:Chaperone of endosialidase
MTSVSTVLDARFVSVLADGAMITGSGNVCIGQGIQGVAAVDNTTWIRNVYDSVASDRAVYVNSDNKIGTLASSRRYKEEIKPMDKTSEALLSLKPVTFRYKQELDPHHVPMFGLIAEEVENVNPDLVSRDKEGKPFTVRYDAVNAMLLNEFLKARRQIDVQQKQIEALTAGLQKVSAQLEASKFATGRIRGGGPAPQVVDNL